MQRRQKVAGKIALIFAGIYSALIMIVYFTQCTSVVNDNLSEEALKVLDYSHMGLLFNLDLLGYAIMALSTFFIGLTLNVKNKKDKVLKYLLLLANRDIIVFAFRLGHRTIMLVLWGFVIA